MFNSCALRITSPKDASKWMEVKLSEATPPFLKAEENTERVWIEWVTAIGAYHFRWWGKWRPTGNSLDSKYNYSIGNAPPEKRFWGFSPYERQLHFMEFSKSGGGGLEYGELKDEFGIALTLDNAALNSHGVEPLDSLGTGKGTIKIASAFFPFGPVLWTDI